MSPSSARRQSGDSPCRGVRSQFSTPPLQPVESSLGFALTEAVFFYGLVAGLLSYVLK